MNTDPRDIISKQPMTWMQVTAVVLTVFLNALDGFDVLAISYASPGIAKEWGLARDALGIVLSMELIGMALGSLCLGGVADKIGRRPTMLGCLVVMAVGMFMATTSNGVLGTAISPLVTLVSGKVIDARLLDLSFWRVITGLGIGGMLAAINAVAAEYANLRRRDLAVAIMSIGYPLGAVFGGLAVAPLVDNGWRIVFYFGTVVTVIMIPLVYLFIPETVHWLSRKQPVGALERINKTLRRMGHSTVAALPVLTSTERKSSVADVFRPGLIAITILCAAAYFFHIMTFYFILKWVPKIVVDFGFAASSAAGVLIWTNVGGATGGVVLGLATQRFGLKGLTMIAMLMSTAAVIVFGRTPHDLAQLSLICAVAGFGTNGAIVGMYAIFARAFPTHVRAFGTGLSIGVGRGGSVLAPIVAGFLFTGGYTLPNVALLMSLGSLVAAGVLLFLKLTPERPAPALAERTGGTNELKGATV